MIGRTMTGNAGPDGQTGPGAGNSAAASPADAAIGDGVGTPSRAITALIVDDEPDQLGLLTEYFHRAGCTVIAVHDAERALALPRDLRPDVMVIDLRLPGMDGWQLAKELRLRYPASPIAITSVLDVDDYPAAEAVLPKPVTRAQVRTLVEGLISSRTRA